jgi:hypothetical protein
MKNEIKQEVKCHICKRKIKGYAYPIGFKKNPEGFVITTFICEKCREKV